MRRMRICAIFACYYPALDLPWDVESALNCLVLW